MLIFEIIILIVGLITIITGGYFFGKKTGIVEDIAHSILEFIFD